MHFLFKLCLLFLLLSVSDSQKRITFQGTFLKNFGSPCTDHHGANGYCESINNCPEIKKMLDRKQMFFRDVRCTPTKIADLICCGKKKEPIISIGKLYDISPPPLEIECGLPYFDYGTDLRTIYEINETAQQYIRDGYTVTPIEVDKDKLLSFHYRKQNIIGQYPDPKDNFNNVFFSIGGINAQRQLAKYMVLLGVRDNFFCDGVLINREWVLSAAHCFDESSKLPSIVRVGEYDVSNDSISANEYPLDIPIKSFLIHPDYKPPSVYHDLVLVQLNKKTPYYRDDINPLCLPWGNEVSKSLVKKVVTLTGWGVLYQYGPSAPILQEVNVTVFDTAVCDKSYSTLADYIETFPNGIIPKFSLCAGDSDGGKDACQGDSGGPIAYLTDDIAVPRYTLAGIVSTGYGCGRAEFPGIYVPITEEYLHWIKKIAF